ncbi:MAG: undecaprenyl/decaprenyl-phosphate alpha-N-acetylglucosaminyl 1-phosphate transferase [Chlamydiae bacterium]|nr:undecaprenyl/decaprenyl-phosphate alpha-N-acetylglucosaminyl 1-phosphate transferase [Chlamydiota bacterium]MBI3276179.1 undecaprenyl/decaprenyl-phosphate alpha-N-acetylglucosaminyl 1-phosphate transferase [Chlamydiota bacterium]
MRTYLAAFIISLMASLILVPVVKRMAFRLKAFGQGEALPIPRLGGVAVYFSFLLPLIGLFFYENGVSVLFWNEAKLCLGIFLGGTFILLLGVWDDLKNLSPWRKLMIEFLIASFVYACGFKIGHISSPSLEKAFSLGIFSFPVTLLWIVGLMNAVNLIDGIDGLACGISLFVVVTLGSIAFMTGQSLTILLCVALAGSLLGFIRYNFNPAQIYLGDSGSLLLGYLLSIFSIWGSNKASTMVAFLTPMVALGLPIIDMVVSMSRRYFSGVPIFKGDREHIHHRLKGMGFSQRKVVLLLYGFCILLNGLALFLYVSNNPHLILVFIALCSLLGLKYLGYLKPHVFKDRIEEFGKIRKERFYRYILRELVKGLKTPALEERVWHLTREFSEKADFDYARLEMENLSKSIEWSRSGLEGTLHPYTQIILPLLVDLKVIGKIELRKVHAPLDPSQKDHALFLGADLLTREIAKVVEASFAQVK